jgi:Zn-dependent protease with chaperone function
MSESLVLNKRVLTGLPASAFQHPWDKAATSKLESMSVLNKLVAKFNEHSIERVAYVQNLGSNLRVGPRQASKLYQMLRECCEILDVKEPELYIQQGDVNAYTAGHNRPYIVLETGLLEVMDYDEVMGVIAHELGHIKCGHVLYKQISRIISPLIEMVGRVTLGVGNLVGMGIEAALIAWDRKSELSADRAALLVLQDPKPCVTMLMKLAGGTNRWDDQLDAEQFLNQARSYKEGLDDKLLDRFYRFLANTARTHPVCVERARELDMWVQSKEYTDILQGFYYNTNLPTKNRLCPTCKTPAPSAEARFCHCGTPLPGR